MPSIEAELKKQFARTFEQKDWNLFKRMADLYLKQAVVLKSASLDVDKNLRLLARNCQKRLFLGIGSELLLKAAYLRLGYTINKFVDSKSTVARRVPVRFGDVGKLDQNPNETFTFNDLILSLDKLKLGGNAAARDRGLRIAKVFRNKEGHVVVSSHTPDDSNYRDIEAALKDLYLTVFDEELSIQISFRRKEKAIWQIRKRQTRLVSG